MNLCYTETILEMGIKFQCIFLFTCVPEIVNSSTDITWQFYLSLWITMSFSKPIFKRLRQLPFYSHLRQIASYDGPSYEAVRTIRKENLNPAMLTYYREPLLIHSGKMQYLYDEKGIEYLDMFAGIVTVSVGHCHPKVNEALQKQIETLWHTTNIYLHPKIHEYALKLVETLPDPLKV